ncbi:condensation domain-containing protein [Streptomyces sp. INA 01156]
MTSCSTAGPCRCSSGNSSTSTRAGPGPHPALPGLPRLAGRTGRAGHRGRLARGAPRGRGAHPPRPRGHRPAAGHPDQLPADLPADLTARLLGAAREHGLTLNTLLQGAWAVVLGRLTGRDDVVFGGTVSGWPPQVPGVESMIGLFINTLPVRVRIVPGRAPSRS